MIDADSIAPSTRKRGNLLRDASRVAAIGIFLIALVAALYSSRTLLTPIVAAVFIGIMMGPLASRLSGIGLPPSLVAISCVVLMILVLNLALVLLGSGISEWMARSTEFTAAMKSKAYLFARPLAAWREIQDAIGSMLGAGGSEPARVELPMQNILASAVEFLTPAIGEAVIFFGCLFFFILSRDAHKRSLVRMVRDQDKKLRVLRIVNEVEARMVRYVTVVTAVNIGVGVFTAALIYFCGLPSPLLWGVAAFMLNYVPYVGPAVVTVILAVLGIVTLPTIQAASVAPILFVIFGTIEGHFFTPSLMGRQMTLSPAAMFISLVFWTWLWGPLGTFLAMPLLIVMAVIYHHIAPEEGTLPG